MVYLLVGLSLVFLSLVSLLLNANKRMRDLYNSKLVLETILRQQGDTIKVKLKDYNEQVAKGYTVELLDDETFIVKFL